jgi:uncharacterized protein
LTPHPKGLGATEKLAAATANPSRPSFNCRRTNTDVMRMICNDRDLTALDARLAQAYRRAVNRADLSRERWLDTDQAVFLNERARCTTPDCISRSYQIRIRELESVP